MTVSRRCSRHLFTRNRKKVPPLPPPPPPPTPTSPSPPPY
ncbi:hypothetical protein E2C01_078392 [Portunus trituberculatus]|uniref:Uncharacterized protein n=1 Tax=Portunus trituberculatus TaxID=210409 RepID=A0A5B7IQ35_PORTR|nr:hypothetical protein [Portunus trituberculatus]